MAAEGASLVLVDRSETRDDVVAGIIAAGGNATAFGADLETWEGCVSALNFASNALDGIDILVNNVGGTIWAQPYEHYLPGYLQSSKLRCAGRYFRLSTVVGPRWPTCYLSGAV